MVRALYFTLLILCLFLFNTFVSSASGIASSFNKLPLYTSVATINNKIIYKSDLINRLKILHVLNNKFNINSADNRKAVLEKIINEILILNKIRFYKFAISRVQVDNEINALLKAKKMKMKALFIKAHKLTVSKPEILQYFHKQALIKNFIESFTYSASIPSKVSVNNLYSSMLDLNNHQAYLLQVIFVSGKSIKSKKKASYIYKKLKNGKSFNSMVSLFASNIYDQKTHGFLGWIYSNQLSSSVLLALSKVKKGQFTQPIKKSDGYYIYLIKDKNIILSINPEDLGSAERLKQSIRESLRREKSRAIFNDYISNLRDHSTISYNQLL